MHVQIIGADALRARLTEDQQALRGEKPFYLRKCGDAIQTNIQTAIAAQLEMRTGALWDSVRVFNETKNGISVGTGKGLDYVWPLEFGAVPHRITAGGKTIGVRDDFGWRYSLYDPRGASMLHFFNKYGDEVFAKSVWHPGNPAYRFVYHGAMASWSEIAIFSMRYLRDIFGAAL